MGGDARLLRGRVQHRPLVGQRELAGGSLPFDPVRHHELVEHTSGVEVTDLETLHRCC